MGRGVTDHSLRRSALVKREAEVVERGASLVMHHWRDGTGESGDADFETAASVPLYFFDLPARSLKGSCCKINRTGESPGPILSAVQARAVQFLRGR